MESCDEHRIEFYECIKYVPPLVGITYGAMLLERYRVRGNFSIRMHIVINLDASGSRSEIPGKF